MLLRLLAVAVLALSPSVLAADAVAAPPAKKKKCKAGYALKTVKAGSGRKAKRVKKCVKVKRAAAPVKPVAPAPAPVPPPVTQQPQLQKTRDDDAARQAMGSMGDALRLEKAEFGGSGQTATYERIWFFASGQFQWYTINWNSVSGESCGTVRRGTWTLKEGGRASTDKVSGVYAIVSITMDGKTADELLSFNDKNPSSVYVGVQDIRFDKNAQIADNC